MEQVFNKDSINPSLCIQPYAPYIGYEYHYWYQVCEIHYQMKDIYLIYIQFHFR